MDTIWGIDLSSRTGPKYQVLASALAEAVRLGHLAPGQQLPTVRDLAWELKITPGTVARAYALATQKGITEAVVGRGTFVAQRVDPPLDPAQSFMEPPPLAALRGQESGLVDLRSLRLPDVGQTQEVAAAMERVARRITPLDLDYPSSDADLNLRDAVGRWLADDCIGLFGPEDIVLTSGGQQAISTVLAAELNGPRPVVLTEDLAYPGIRHAARLARAEVVGVEMDDEGILPSSLENLCRRHQPQLLCLTLQGQNPTAARMGMERRHEIAALARAYDLTLIEDNCYSVPDPGAPGMRALAPERSYCIGSLSKTIAPALRFGWIVAPTGRAQLSRLVMRHTQFGVSALLGEICRDLFETGAAAQLRDNLRRDASVRLEMMVNYLGGFELNWQPDLAFVWLKLPFGWRASTFARAAEGAGVLVRPADEFALLHGRAPHALRLTLGGSSSLSRFEAALATLQRLLSQPPSDLSA